MSESKQSGSDDSQSTQESSNRTRKKLDNSNSNKPGDLKSQGEVLFSLPGGFKYQLPGKRQRLILGSLVIGLNLILVLAVIIYFYSPKFQTFVYNFGR